MEVATAHSTFLTLRKKTHIPTKWKSFLFNDIHTDTYNPIFELLTYSSSPESGHPD
jgi:hypothetical protein